MKRSRFSEDQIIRIVHEHEAGACVKDLSRKYGVTDVTLYRWRSKYGAMDYQRMEGRLQ